MKTLSVCLLACPAFAAVAAPPPGSVRPDLYRDGWIDFNKNGRKDVFEDRTAPVEARVDDLLGQMTRDEKTAQLATLYGYGRVLADPLPTPAWRQSAWKDGIGNIDEMHNGVGKYTGDVNPHLASPAATVRALNEVQRWFIEETRLGVPAEFTTEGIRGVCYYRSTNFPSLLSLGATFNRTLVSDVFSVVAKEGKAVGYRNIYAPLLDLSRDPRWGRVVETFGEDPYLVSELGLATTRAIQAEGVVSTAKHFAVYSEPKGGRDGNARTDPHVAPREMERLHLWPWERLVREGGLLGVMSSYNDYDGVPISGSREFLVDRLRTQWGFRGYVVSDSWAVEYLHDKHRVAATEGEAAAMFVREGGNVRTAFNGPEKFLDPLRAEMAAGRLTDEAVNARVREVLRVKIWEGLFDQPYGDEAAANAALHQSASRELALRAARESLVLLRNRNDALPLPTTLKRLLVCGPAATMEETSRDRYGSQGGEVVSPLAGLRRFLASTQTEVVYTEGCGVVDSRWPESEVYGLEPTPAEEAGLAEAARLAAGADAVVVVLGDSMGTVGESLSRTSLDLPGLQNELVRRVRAAAPDKPVVVVLLSGRPATINWIDRHASAVLQAWFPGEAGGTAIAEALFGAYNPGGKLPVTFPRSVGQLPFNFPFKPGSHAKQSRTYDPNGFGSSAVEGALYPFGHGLSYTRFTYANLVVGPERVPADGRVRVSLDLTNAGTRAGDEVVQLYVRDEYSSVTTYELNLADFARVHLAPGETRRVELVVPVAHLDLIDRSGRRRVEPGYFTVRVGASSEDLRLTGRFEVVE